MVGIDYLLCIPPWENGEPQIFSLAALGLGSKNEPNFVRI
jgi:hypothetical protein